MKATGILYTDNRAPEQMFRLVVDRITKAAAGDVQLICMATEDLDMPEPWEVHVVNEARGYMDCYVKILAGAQVAQSPNVFLLEHDVLYPDEYFSFVPPREDTFYYQMHVYTMNRLGFWSTPRLLTSNCVACRDLLIACFQNRIGYLSRGGRIDWDEPGRCCCDAYPYAAWQQTMAPTIDIRYGGNLTGMREAPGDRYVHRIPYWPRHDELWTKLGLNKEA